MYEEERFHVAIALTREAAELFDALLAKENKRMKRVMIDFFKPDNGYARDGLELRTRYYTPWEEDGLMVRFFRKFFQKAKEESYLFIRVGECCSSTTPEVKGKWNKNPFNLKLQTGYTLSYNAV